MGDLASDQKAQPHVAVCPSAGIGHLVPFLRLASMLSSSSSNIKVTLITIQPTLSSAESNQISSFLSSHPNIASLDVHIDAQKPPTDAGPAAGPKGGPPPDPFFVRYGAISRSSHLLAGPLSSLSPPLTAVFSDIMYASGLGDALSRLSIPNYLLVTTSARFFSLTTYIPSLGAGARLEVEGDEVEFPPGMTPVPRASVPPPFFVPDHVFTKMLVSNSATLGRAKGVVFNTFDFLEDETVSALRARRALSFLPQVLPLGPLKEWGGQRAVSGDTPSSSTTACWLDRQPAGSVMYVSFGSRTAMGREQIRELGEGLERSGERFLWVVKTAKVDREERESLEELLGAGFLERVKQRGLVLKEWVDQEAILDHPSIGGFLTHCGWNSVMEAAQRGVPMLAWPQHGDQKVNAGVVEKAGLGVWGGDWGWERERLVKGDEIAEKIKKVMNNNELRASAKRVAQEANKAWDQGGSSREMLVKIVNELS